LFADDSSPEVLESISNVLLNAGKPASAEKILLKSLGSKNNEYTAMHNLANLYFSMKKQQAAENYGFRMMTLYPEKTGGYEILSRIFILKGKHLEAAHLLFEVCKRNTENIDCLISVAKEQEITEDWSGYRETIAGFLQLINKSGRDDLLLIYYRLRAIMNYRNGNFTEALADINLALNKNSSDQASLRLGAQIYESLGNYIEAVNILEKLLNLNPSDSWAYQKSSELKVKIRTIIKK
jgi:tetratricopeptide (TPR) repeat protein